MSKISFPSAAVVLIAYCTNAFPQEHSPTTTPATAVISPATSALPRNMSGRWSQGLYGNNIWAIEIAEQKETAEGIQFSGTIKHWSRTCNTDAAPMTGTYAQGALVIDAVVGTSAQKCSRHFTLMKATDHLFTGSVVGSDGRNVDVYLD